MALAEMLDVEGESIYKLAADIAKRGMLNPVEPLIVVQDGTRFTVLEGNRRLCALRLLEKPSLAPEADRSKYERLKKNRVGRIPSVAAAVAVDRDQADDWIEMKHSQASGKGIKSWGARQKANFQARRSGELSNLERLINAVETWYADDTELIAELDTVLHGGQYTNLDRILDAAETKERLGLEVSGGRVLSYYAPTDLKPFFKSLINGLATPLPTGQSWSRVWSNKDARIDWLKEPSSHAPPEELKGSSPKIEHIPEDHPNTRPVPATEAASSARSTRQPQDPFQGPKFKFSNVRVHDDYSAAVRKLVGEIGRINVDEAPNIAVDAIRTLLEKTIKSYAYLQNEAIPHRGNFVGYGDCLNWLSTHVQQHDDLRRFQGTTQQIKSSRSSTWTLSADALNAANHSEWAVFRPADAQAIWSTVHDLLKALLERGPDGRAAVATN